MDWEIKKRGRVTYYRKKTNDVFSDLVVEELDNGDLKIRFVGMTGALAATNELELDEVARMDPEKEVPRIFDTWEMYVREAGICDSLAELDFLEVHSFGAAPKAPHPLVDAEGYAAEKQRIRQAYARAYAAYWKEKMPENGLPVRFTVYLEELPDTAASYEFGAVALYQKR
ncbi:MAG: hypothetical protein O7E52_20520 [Candidatus Poribacteria bacterium]|nr:hypothetical protein [Candidatus Poribacteria bacterium]